MAGGVAIELNGDGFGGFDPNTFAAQVDHVFVQGMFSGGNEQQHFR
jgi:hypothetical protein